MTFDPGAGRPAAYHRSPLARRLQALAAGTATAVSAFHAGLVIVGCAAPSPPRGELLDASPPPVADSRLELALRYAPFVYQETDPRRGREDLPANVDFDGDLVGNNNWENFDRFRLVPTVYYAALETETHSFLTYHLFHPRDWSPFPLGLQDTHENDGENLQIVVEKSNGRPVLLLAQAHYRGRAYAKDRSRFRDGEERLRGGFLTVDAQGRPEPAGEHACVFVQSQGHGIYGTEDRASRVAVRADGTFAFRRGSGLLLRPAREGEDPREPASSTRGVVPYRLQSTTAKFWPGLRGGTLVGGGTLFDWTCAYRDDRVDLPRLPRAYDGNRYSGPLGNDRGISPFAVSFGFSGGEVGSLFFDPAARWRRALRVPEPWSLRYLDDPFAPEAPR